MRTWGRITNADGSKTWVKVESAGYDDNVWLTTLCQTLKLGLGESPFYGNYGIPSYQSIMQQFFPNFYVARTQQQFQQYFSSLAIAQVQGQANPTYNVQVIFNNGAIVNQTVAL